MDNLLQPQLLLNHLPTLMMPQIDELPQPHLLLNQLTMPQLWKMDMLPTVNFDDTTKTEIESAAISVTIVATLAAIIVILVTIIAIIVIVVLLRRKASRAGTACEEIVYDEIPDATRRQDLQQVTDIIQTGSNPAYDKPASHLRTSSKEMELTQKYAYVSSGAQRVLQLNKS